MQTDFSPSPLVGLRFELRYRRLSDPGRGFTFPCDERGRVELDGLSERARIDYLYARHTVGFRVAPPVIMAVE